MSAFDPLQRRGTLTGIGAVKVPDEPTERRSSSSPIIEVRTADDDDRQEVVEDTRVVDEQELAAELERLQTRRGGFERSAPARFNLFTGLPDAAATAGEPDQPSDEKSHANHEQEPSAIPDDEPAALSPKAVHSVASEPPSPPVAPPTASARVQPGSLRQNEAPHRTSGFRSDRVEVTHFDREPGPSSPTIPPLQEQTADIAATYRRLRHLINTEYAARVIAVTSPDTGEGKTSCAVNLAMAFAEYGHDPVLLVEANARRPRASHLVGVTPPACFTEQMRAATTNPTWRWQTACRTLKSLHYLCIDPETPRKPALEVAAFSESLHQLRAIGYSYVVVDCPAVLESADMSVIEDTVDAILLTALSGRTRKSRLRRAAAHLQPTTLLGTVLFDRQRGWPFGRS